MNEKRRKTKDVKVRLKPAVYGRLQAMADRLNVTITSLATSYVVRALEKEEQAGIGFGGGATIAEE